MILPQVPFTTARRMVITLESGVTNDNKFHIAGNLFRIEHKYQSLRYFICIVNVYNNVKSVEIIHIIIIIENKVYINHYARILLKY